MNMFASAYRQLRPAERAYVDGYVQDVERDAQRTGQRISNALHRSIPAETVEQSRGMLDRPLVRAAIAERINDLAAASELTVQRVLKELSVLAFSSMEHYTDIAADGSRYINFDKCTPEQMAAVQSCEVEENQSMRSSTKKAKVRLYNKQDALNTLTRIMGMLETDNAAWRMAQARPVDAIEAPTLPGDVTAHDAADLYARMING